MRKLNLLWSLLALLVLLMSACAAEPRQGALTSAEAEGVIAETAAAFMNDRIAEASQNTGLQVAESELTTLCRAAEFADWPSDGAIQLWQLEYRLRPEGDINSVPLPDFAQEDGWITEAYGLGRHMLLFRLPEQGEPELLGELNRQDFGESLASLENAARALLEDLGILSPETFPGRHVVVQFPLSDGEVCQVLLSQPVRQDKSGIWCAERWVQGNGNLYYIAPSDSGSLTLEEYWAEKQAACDEGHQPWRLDPVEVAVDGIKRELGQWTLRREQLNVIEDAKLEDFARLPESHYFGYILDFPTENLNPPYIISHFNAPDVIFHFDVAEWLTAEDEERLAELGMTEADMPNGFYIYNPQTWPHSFALTSDTQYSFFADVPSELTTTYDPAEFAAYLLPRLNKNDTPPFRVTTQNDLVTKIEEQYLP